MKQAITGLGVLSAIIMSIVLLYYAPIFWLTVIAVMVITVIIVGSDSIIPMWNAFILIQFIESVNVLPGDPLPLVVVTAIVIQLIGANLKSMHSYATQY